MVFGVPFVYAVVSVRRVEAGHSATRVVETRGSGFVEHHLSLVGGKHVLNSLKQWVEVGNSL